jgi:hypothetical protein
MTAQFGDSFRDRPPALTMTDRDEQFVIGSLQSAHIAEYLLFQPRGVGLPANTCYLILCVYR